MTTQNTAPRSAASPAAEYGLGHDLESDLPVIPALAEINHIRVIDKSGASYRATPAQMREMVGIDYSILTEQIVPGEYWIGSDGKRRQVYTRTFQGANSPESFKKSTFDKYGHAWTFYQIGSIRNYKLVYASVGGYDFNDTVTGEPNYIWKGLELWFKESVNPKFNNVSYVLTLKYTKP